MNHILVKCYLVSQIKISNFNIGETNQEKGLLSPKTNSNSFEQRYLILLFSHCCILLKIS